MSELKDAGKPIFRFKGRTVIADDSGYMHPRWDLASHIEVTASTRSEAGDKAFAMLGKSAQRGSSWRIKWDSFEEVGE